MLRVSLRPVFDQCSCIVDSLQADQDVGIVGQLLNGIDDIGSDSA